MENSSNMVVPKEERRRIVLEAHDLPTSGHLGIFKTYHRIVERFYWPNMKSDVVLYVNRCETCVAHKVARKKSIGFMLQQPIPSRPWEVVSTDLIGPFPRSTKGNQYVLVVSDYFLYVRLRPRLW